MSAFRRVRRMSRPAGAAAAATTVSAVALALVAGVPVPAAQAALVPEPVSYSAADAALTLSALGTYETGVFDESAAEIVAYYDDRVFVVNAQAGAVDVLDVSTPAAPTKITTLTSDGVANSLAIRADGLGVIAVESTTKTDNGRLVFFDAEGTGGILGSVEVGALPDMVAISADGRYAVVANEGEPNEDYTVDPEGSVSVVALPATVAAAAQSAVRTADFSRFEADGDLPLDPDVRIFAGIAGNDNPVSRGLEPEYVAIDGDLAYVALQEANAVAVVDIAEASVTDIWSLGFKDHGAEGNGIDPSDRDPADGDPEDGSSIDIRTFDGLHGVYMPDGINAYSAGGETYLVTANEGDAREWGDYEEGARVADLPVCATSPLAAHIGDDELGRLNVTTENGFDEKLGCYDELYAFGARSFSIWTTDGEQVFDSGSMLEEITAAANPAFFNSNHSESNLEGRSDDKGPEPENLTIGEIDGRTYAFIGFERVGGIGVFDLTNPSSAEFVTYLNNRDFSVSVEDAADPATALAAAGDLGPEGLTFVAADVSPTSRPLLVVGNEVSGTTTLFDIDVTADAPIDSPADGTTSIQVLGINDFHGRIEGNPGNGEAGAAVLAGAVAELRAANANTLFVSAGDNIGASTFTSFSQQDDPTIDALVAAGLDASVVGNHEFDGGFADLTDRVLPRYGDARFGLGANVYLTGTTTPALDEYWVSEVDGVRVGFIGTVTETTAAMVSPDGIADIEFGDQLTAANRVADQLQDGDDSNGEADVLILLTHDGAETTDCTSIAAGSSTFSGLVTGASPRIDAVLSGHTHAVYDCSFPVAGWATGVERPVLQSGQYGANLDRLMLEIDRADNSVVSLSADVLPLTDGTVGLYPADAAVASIVDAASAEAEVVGSREIGSISADITRAGTDGSDRGSESSLGNLVADMHLWATSNESFGGEPAQIALMNPGGLRADLLYGENGSITYRDVASVQPFGNTLVTMDLTGAQLKQILEEQWQPDGASRPKLHLGVSDGFGYEYDPDAARGERITSMSYRGADIEADDVFRVAANSFLAAGGDNFVTFAEGTDRADSGQIDLVAAVQYFEAFAVVEPAPLGRAMEAGTDAGTPATPETPGTPGTPGTGTPEDGDPGNGDDAGIDSGSDSDSDEDGAYGTGTGDRDDLAYTGSDAAPIAALAGLLLIGGLLLVRRSTRATRSAVSVPRV